MTHLVIFSDILREKELFSDPDTPHFVFTAPIDPKLVLISSAWMNYLFSIIVWLLIGIGSLTVFRIPILSAAVIFLTGCVLELAFEVADMIFLYTNDRVPGKN